MASITILIPIFDPYIRLFITGLKIFTHQLSSFGYKRDEETTRIDPLRNVGSL